MLHRFQITTRNGPVIVELNADTPQMRGLIEYKGNAEAVAEVKSWLRLQYGARGHFIGTRASAIDLDYALNTLAYSVQRLEGTVESYGLDLPEGAKS